MALMSTKRSDWKCFVLTHVGLSLIDIGVTIAFPPAAVFTVPTVVAGVGVAIGGVILTVEANKPNVTVQKALVRATKGAFVVIGIGALGSGFIYLITGNAAAVNFAIVVVDFCARGVNVVSILDEAFDHGKGTGLISSCVVVASGLTAFRDRKRIPPIHRLNRAMHRADIGSSVALDLIDLICHSRPSIVRGSVNNLPRYFFSLANAFFTMRYFRASTTVGDANLAERTLRQLDYLSRLYERLFNQSSNQCTDPVVTELVVIFGCMLGLRMLGFSQRGIVTGSPAASNQNRILMLPSHSAPRTIFSTLQRMSAGGPLGPLGDLVQNTFILIRAGREVFG